MNDDELPLLLLLLTTAGALQARSCEAHLPTQPGSRCHARHGTSVTHLIQVAVLPLLLLLLLLLLTTAGALQACACEAHLPT
jgi:hypothetical protein